MTATDPDAAYLAATTKIDFSATANSTNLTSITDGSLTVTFSGIMSKRQVPSSWLTWSSPPNSESATPAVLYSNSAFSETLTLSRGVTTFGFEAEPAVLMPFDITVTYYNGASVIGTVTRSVTGASGARLFAATATAGDRITSVVISSLVSFAIAQVRYDPTVQVTIDIKPGSATNPINPGSKGTTPVAILTTATFDAATVDVSTVRLGGTPVVIKKNGTYQASLEDVDGDGDLDLVLHFSTPNLPLPPGTTSLTLTGSTLGGTAILGSDVVTRVP